MELQNVKRYEGTSKVKTHFKLKTDTERRKLGEQNRLETCVVLAVNDDNQIFLTIRRRVVANALNYPPKDYDRKIKI